LKRALQLCQTKLFQPRHTLVSLPKALQAEAPLEGSQGAFGQYGQNVALQQAGADVTPMQGVLGAGLRDAAVGALFGGAASPLQL
jgi:hypothetical protein